MDLTTLMYAALIALGLIGADVALYSGSVVVEATPPPKTTAVDIDQFALLGELAAVLTAVGKQGSAVEDISWSNEQSAGLVLLEALNLERLAFALQIELGFSRDRLRLSLVTDGGTLRGIVAGSSAHSGFFNQTFTQEKGESAIELVRRCSLWGVAQLAPYATALFLFRSHAADRDFTEAVALAEHRKTALPPTPISPDRSLFENLLGLIALFKNDLSGAATQFAQAMAADPTNPMPFINAAFVDLQSGDYRMAATRMEQLLRLAPPQNDVLVATAYMTWAASLMAMRDLGGADRLLAAAIQADPDSATALSLWAEEKRLAGDTNAADQLEHRALEKTASFQNYAEVAALYFHLAWGNERTLEPNRFPNPTVRPLH